MPEQNRGATPKASQKQVNKRAAKVLLLSGYDASSHRFWRHQLAEQLNEFEWTQIALPDRYFSWRIRGNSLTFAFDYAKELQRHYDCLVVTSMVDLSSLRGFAPQLANLPTLVYVHENQFEYPVSANEEADKGVQQANRINAQLTSIYSMVCADQVLFNSNFNLKTFFSGAKKLVKRLPDGVPKDLLRNIENKCDVLPVPIANTKFEKMTSKARYINGNDRSPGADKTSNGHILEFLWNHRWEYDKQPEVLFDALKLLKQKGFNFRLHVMGQSFRQIPECFAQAKEELSDQIVTWGYQPQEEYEAVLKRADVVISTALHDFQGLSLLEAIARGAVPVAPNRVAYPEYVNQIDLYPVNGKLGEAEHLCNHLEKLYQRLFSATTEYDAAGYQASVKRYCSSDVIPQYRAVIQRLFKKRT